MAALGYAIATVVGWFLLGLALIVVDVCIYMGAATVTAEGDADEIKALADRNLAYLEAGKVRKSSPWEVVLTPLTVLYQWTIKRRTFTRSLFPDDPG